jgi:hypothetical protein
MWSSVSVSRLAVVLLLVFPAPGGEALAEGGQGEKGGEKAKEAPAGKKEPAGKDAEKGAARKGRTVLKTGVPLERLIELNAAALFGSGKVKVGGGRVEVLLDKDGDLASSFEGSGLVDSRHEQMQGANRKFIQYGDQKDGEKLLPGLAGIGMEKGIWVSRFPLAGDTKVTFQIRVPNLLTRLSSIKLRINWNGKTGYETNFFGSIAKVSNDSAGAPRWGPDPKFKKPAPEWFPRRGEPVPVEFGMEEGRCVVRFENKEVVAYPKLKDSGGKVVFIFNKVLFTVQSLKISGKLDLEWCRERLAELEKKGELREEAPAAAERSDAP